MCIHPYYRAKIIHFVQLEQNNSETTLTKSDELGTCSERASKMGNHQKVVAYSLYGEPDSAYWGGIPTLALWIKEFYPGWLMRIYTNNPTPLQYLEKEHPYLVFVCDVRNLPSPLIKYNIGNCEERTWRFAPLLDPQVDVMLSRDSDSIVRFLYTFH